MKKKALLYGLTAAVLLAAALTACHQTQADQPSEPDPAASSAVQTDAPDTTPEPSTQTTPEPPAQTPEPTQTPEPAPTDAVEPQATKSTEPAADPEQTTTPAPATTPTPTQKPAESKPNADRQDTTSQPSGSGTQLAGEPINGNSGASSNTGSNTGASEGLTPEEQAIRDQMLHDREGTVGVDGPGLTAEQMDDMLHHVTLEN